MKSVGIIRKVDNLGRVVIPKELRTKMDIKEGTEIEILANSENITLRKYNPGCHCCGETTNDLKDVLGINLCDKCIKEIYENSRKIIDSLR